MQTEVSARFPELAVRHGVLVVDGFGVSVRVQRGRLIVRDGLAGHARHIELARPNSGLRRFVLLSRSGSVTLEALRWLADIGSGYAQFDTDGRLLATSSVARSDDPRLRRAQALAVTNGTDIALARDLIRHKLEGQARVVAQLGEHVSAAVLDHVARLDDATTIEAIMRVEAAAAALYWQSWARVEVPFDRMSAERIPEHWCTFGVRGSGLGNGARLATNPANALLNYSYALAEVECRLALAAIGLDPGLGVLHVDQRARDSMALDLLEVVRPDVDAWVLDLLRTQILVATDFHETRQGNCRILAPLTHVLAETLVTWRRIVAPIAEEVARTFGASAARPVRVATKLTQDRRREGRDDVRIGGRRQPRVRAVRPPAACLVCGLVLHPSSRARYCDDCRQLRMDEHRATFAMSGQVAMRKLRAEGRDPSKSVEAIGKLSVSQMRTRALNAAWDLRHPERLDPASYRRDILPHLANLPLKRLMDATELSANGCSKIRRGLVVPHERHWEALARIGTWVTSE